MAILDSCTNLLAQTSSAVPIKTSAVVEYDGSGFACVPLPASPSTLNQVLKAIDDEVCNIKNNLLVDIDTSSITTYDGTPSFGCFSLTPSGSLNTIINEIGDQICSNTTRLDALATSDVLTYDGTPTFACFSFSGGATLNDVIDELGLEICTNQSSIAAKADLSLLETYTKEIRKNYVEAGGDTANISGISIDIENTAGGSSVYYVDGVRTAVATETLDDTGGTPVRKRLIASSDNYLDFDTDGDYTVTAVPNGNPAPAVSGMRMWIIITDGVSITGTTDLRNVTPIDGVDICDLTITDAKMVANTLTSGSMTSIIAPGTTNVANVTVDAAGRVTTLTSDFDIAAPSDLDLVQFQSGSGKWENVTVGSIGLLLPSGTAGQTLRSDGANWLANSVLYNNGTNVGIGTSSPTEILTVAGNIAPDADATRDIGTVALGYANIYMSSNLHYTADLTFTRSGVDQASFGNSSFVFGGTSGDASALMELQSTTQGFVAPKMTTAQKLAISTPLEGLIVYDTDLNSPFFFDGGSWVTIFAGSDGDWTVVGNDVQMATVGNVLPNTDDANDLGSSSLRFKDLYLGSIIDYNQNLDFKSGGTVRVSFENSGKVGIGTTAPVETSALMELVSTTSGLLQPRMNTTQRDALTPAEGLSIYNLTTTDVEFWDGSSWMGSGTNDGNGIFDVANDGGTVATTYTVNLTDTLEILGGKVNFNIAAFTADYTFRFHGDGASRHGIEIVQDSSHVSSGGAIVVSNIGTTAAINKGIIASASGAGTNYAIEITAGDMIMQSGTRMSLGTASMIGDFTIRSSGTGVTVIDVLDSTFTSDIFQIKETGSGHGQLVLKNLAPTINVTLDASGLTFDPGSDIDNDLISVDVTGSPKMFWDESDNSFAITSDTTASLSLVAAAGEDSMIRFYENTTERARLQYDVAPTDNLSVRFPGGGDVVMAWYTDGEIKVFDEGETDPAVAGNQFSMFATDANGAGTSSPHFKTEDGDIIILQKTATGYTTFANLSTVRTLDADATTLDEVADALGTLIEDLKNTNLISA